MAPLRSTVLVFFGLISYAFYMVHLFIVQGYDRVRGPLAAGDVRGYWVRFGLLLAAAVGASVLSRYVIELPAMRLRRLVPPLPIAPM